MRPIRLLLSFVLLFPCLAQPKPLPDALFKRWVHSQEEDTPTVKVFRPRGYDFPPARGRQGFEVRKNGEFVQYDIAPADGSRAIPGRWKNIGKSTIEVLLGGQSRKLTILSCDDQVLKLKK
jgi:hypothetical protein